MSWGDYDGHHFRVSDDVLDPEETWRTVRTATLVRNREEYLHEQQRKARILRLKRNRNQVQLRRDRRA